MLCKVHGVTLMSDRIVLGGQLKKFKMSRATIFGMVVGAGISVAATSWAAPAGLPSSFSYVGCNLTTGGTKVVHNDRGRVVVKSGTSSVEVVKRINGKWSSTTKMSSGQTKEFAFTTPDTTKVTSFQLRRNGVYIGEELEIGKAMCKN